MILCDFRICYSKHTMVLIVLTVAVVVIDYVYVSFACKEEAATVERVPRVNVC